MKKINYLMLAIFAMAAMVFTSCDDDDNQNEANFQQIVDKQVKAQKNHEKAILITAFGSTWQQSFDTFDALVKSYKDEFEKEGWDVYLAFSSAICSNQASAWEHKDDGAEKRDYYAPEYWLTAIGKAKYKQVVIQSLQVIPGEEYARVCDVYVKDFLNNKYRVFSDEYMKSLDKQCAVGASLLDTEEDVKAVAAALSRESDVRDVIEAGGSVAFMGHGNPVERYELGNLRYWQLEKALQEVSGKQNFFVGTVDDECDTEGNGENLVEQVIERMNKANVAKDKLVQLYPLMSISGDHAHNDLSDDDDEESWVNMMKAEGYKAQAYETTFKEAKLKSYKQGEGYIPSLAERTSMINIWKQHTWDAIHAIEAGEGISTPTTAADEE